MANLCTDAGHGGGDSGAVWGNVREKDLNLIYTMALNTELKSRGHKVYTTRNSDVNVPSLQTRCDLVNEHHRRKAPQFDAIISVHCNVAAFTDPATGEIRAAESHRGFYAIYSEESSKSKALAKALASRCAAEGITLKHDGMLSTVALRRALAWIHKTLPPAVLLELGFMTNPEELTLLQHSEYQTRLVAVIADGIESYLNG